MWVSSSRNLLSSQENTTVRTVRTCRYQILATYSIFIYVRLSKLLVHEKDISIIWKGPIANHSFVAILPSLRSIDLQGVSLRLNTAEVDIILFLYYSYLYVLLVSTSISCTKILRVLEVIVVRVVLRNWKY